MEILLMANMDRFNCSPAPTSSVAAKAFKLARGELMSLTNSCTARLMMHPMMIPMKMADWLNSIMFSELKKDPLCDRFTQKEERTPAQSALEQ
mmetsp:Transcript_37276/g.89126  ORF Transcript_37276/g.89126 Transcript_37276/m.89126 type:complete len:93 (+) Transcript_37276:653-931(+)